MERLNMYALSEAGEVEQHPAWHGNLSLKEISLLLAHERPLTYILSGSGSNYYLSYFKHRHKRMMHIHFTKAFIKKNGRLTQGYRNGIDIIFCSVDALIKYKMKRISFFLTAFPLRLSA